MPNSQVKLRQTERSDLDFFFRFQLNPEARFLAAFTPKDAASQAAYVEKFSGFLADPTITMQTILVDEAIVGSIAKFELEGNAEITYWLDRAYWGRGIATAALRAFLLLEKTRPITGRVAFDNVGSQKVLEAGGFVKIGTDKGFANARQAEITEFIYKLT
jgi:ribosomal-protein-alanine N-acetyltransferase